MEDLKKGETVPPSLRRVLAVGKDNKVPKESNWKDNGITVAVVDTGVWKDHPDLNVVHTWVGPALKWSGVVDNHGHGTHIAGVIAARNQGQGLVGAAPGVPILSFKVLGQNGDGRLDDIVAAINAIVAYNSTAAMKPSIINFSLTTEATITYDNTTGEFTSPERLASRIRLSLQTISNETYCSLFEPLLKGGATVVAAAGNYNEDFYGRITQVPGSNTFIVRSQLPAACEGVLAVTAVSTTGPEPSPEDKPAVLDVLPGEQERPAVGSNWAGAWPGLSLIDRLIAAPGFNITSTIQEGQTSKLKTEKCVPGPPSKEYPYCGLSGTSQATALVSGLVARCYAAGVCGMMTKENRLLEITGKARAKNKLDRTFGFRGDPLRAADGESSPGGVPPSGSDGVPVSKQYGFLIDGSAWT